MQNWAGYGAIVTGGASGLGAATAARLAEDGLKVTLFDRNADMAKAQASAIGGAYAVVDVGDPASVAAGLDVACAAYGTPRVLINCAGVGGEIGRAS